MEIISKSSMGELVISDEVLSSIAVNAAKDVDGVSSFCNKPVDVVNTIIQENPLANYKNKHRVVEILKEAVANGDELGTESQHIENIKNMLGTDRIFQ